MAWKEFETLWYDEHLKKGQLLGEGSRLDRRARKKLAWRLLARPGSMFGIRQGDHALVFRAGRGRAAVYLIHRSSKGSERNTVSGLAAIRLFGRPRFPLTHLRSALALRWSPRRLWIGGDFQSHEIPF